MRACQPLARDFSVQIDTVEPRAWSEHVADFHDGNIYQLWQDRRSADTSHLVLRRGAAVVGAAEVRLYTLPVTRHGIAYVLWGPLWLPRSDGAADPEVFRQAIRALRNEYVVRRGMILRIVPRLFVDQHPACVGMLADEGFTSVGERRTTRSLVVELTCGLKDVRAGFEQKWRNCLNKAERAGLTLTSGTSLALFDEFVALHEQMLRRKRLSVSADIQKHRRIQERLPEPLKMGVVLARHDAVPCAGAIYSAIGDTAVYLFGATNEAGMRTSASYLVQWDVLSRLKDLGIVRYDLNGVNAAANPGVYHFKRGLAGRRGAEVAFPGSFQALEPSLANHSLLLVERLRRRVKAARSHATVST